MSARNWKIFADSKLKRQSLLWPLETSNCCAYLHWLKWLSSSGCQARCQHTCSIIFILVLYFEHSKSLKVLLLKHAGNAAAAVVTVFKSILWRHAITSAFCTLIPIYLTQFLDMHKSFPLKRRNNGVLCPFWLCNRGLLTYHRGEYCQRKLGKWAPLPSSSRAMADLREHHQCMLAGQERNWSCTTTGWAREQQLSDVRGRRWGS